MTATERMHRYRQRRRDGRVIAPRVVNAEGVEDLVDLGSLRLARRPGKRVINVQICNVQIGVIATRIGGFRGFHALAVDDSSAWTGLAPDPRAIQHD